MVFFVLTLISFDLLQSSDGILNNPPEK